MSKSAKRLIISICVIIIFILFLTNVTRYLSAKKNLDLLSLNTNQPLNSHLIYSTIQDISNLLTYNIICATTAIFLIIILINMTRLRKTIALRNDELTQEICQKETALRQLKQKTHFDSITQALNRAGLQKLLTHIIHNKDQGVLVALGIMNYRQILNIFGFTTSETVLIEFTNRISKIIPSATGISRLDCGTFSLFLKNISIEHATTLFTNNIANFEMVIDTESGPIQTRCAIGLIHTNDLPKTSYLIEKTQKYSSDSPTSEHRTNQQQANKFLHHLIHILHLAQAKPSTKIATYKSYLGSEHLKVSTLRTEMIEALVRDEFSLRYQPQFNLDGSSILGIETLLRWCKGSQHCITTQQVIDELEQSGNIISVGGWVLLQACQQATKWLENDPQLLKTISVNASANQIINGILIRQVTDALKITGLPAHFLEIELTESVLVKDEISALETLTTLKEMGVKIALDDFGKGYASIDYLRKFRFDTIKIDKSFINQIDTNTDHIAILCAILDFLQSLQYENIVIEGVDSDFKLKKLRELGYPILIQGYVFSKPLVASEFENLAYHIETSH
ncbi:MAG TPA: GGDEF domain-containing protein [Methylococcales bacterium]|nr:GGDEF domain-containing protein [Methylococcales bacterium]HIO13427.1 GGDEF domain-containing protein [Methylococcales bacterium]